MQVLLECHNEEDLDSWISSIQMVGVNSRNLATLKTDVTLFETMVEKLPREATWVAESGIASASDIAVLRQSGYWLSHWGCLLTVKLAAQGMCEDGP